MLFVFFMMMTAVTLFPHGDEGGMWHRVMSITKELR